MGRISDQLGWKSSAQIAWCPGPYMLRPKPQMTEVPGTAAPLTHESDTLRSTEYAHGDPLLLAISSSQRLVAFTERNDPAMRASVPSFKAS